MRRRSGLTLGLVVGLFGLVLAGAGCGDDCSVSCDGYDETDVTRLGGTFLGPVHSESRILRFDTVERGVLEIEVFGNTDALDRGDDYVIPYIGPADQTDIQASLPGDCGCGPTITHADGSAVATGFWQITFDWWPSWQSIIVIALALTLPLFAFAYFTRERSPDLG